MLKPLAILGAAALALGASAQAQMTATQTVLSETVTIDEQGREVVRTAPAKNVVPGDRLAYVLTYRNEGAAAAEDLVLVMPVPPTVTLIAGTEEGGAPEHSVDGGQSYGVLADLSVAEDGERRPARPADVTHVRWRLAGSVAPGEAGDVSYRAVLR